MKSRLGQIMREERLRRQMSQAELARACAVDRSTVSNYELGNSPIPKDVLCRAIRVLKSPRLQAQVCFECSANLMTMPYLDRVDMHPMTVRDKVMQELEEAHKALEDLNLVNKLDKSQLTDEDFAALEHAAEQLADLFAAMHTQFAVWQERYDLDVDAAALRAYEKLFERGYATRQSLAFSVRTRKGEVA